MIDVDPQETAPVGAVTPAGAGGQEEPGAAQEDVLKALDRREATDILKVAGKHGIAEDDPLWTAVLAIVKAQALKDDLGATADKITQSASIVGATIFNQALNAGREIQSGIVKELRAAVVQTGKEAVQGIGIATQRASAAIEASIDTLEKAGADKGAVFVQQWKAQAGRAAADVAKTAVQKAIAARWGVVLGSLLTALVIGAAMAWFILDVSGHLLPWNEPLALVNGHINCGFVQALGNRVCEVQ